MSQSVITNAFEQLKAQQAANGSIITLDEFVFANIPGLDTSLPISRDESWPEDSQIVHRQSVGKAGLVNANAVAYSAVMGADVGDFEFNWIGLISSSSQTVCMIVHAPLQKKIKTAAGQQGNVLTRSFLMEYSGASEQTAIVTPVDSWQIDFTARLNGVDERIRLENIDVYGAASFMGNGFKVHLDGSDYIIERGTGYVAGIKATLMATQSVAVSSRPSKIWVDVCWRGTLLSEWTSATKIVVADALTDYIDKDEKHFVIAVAEVLADGSVKDLRSVSVTGQFSQLIAEPDTFPYFDENNVLGVSALTPLARNILSESTLSGVQALIGLHDIDGATKYPSLQMARWRDEGDVRGWGAAGDGITDDTAAIQAALNSRKKCHLPQGRFIITSTLDFPVGAKLIGKGYDYWESFKTGKSWSVGSHLVFTGTGVKNHVISNLTNTKIAKTDAAGNVYEFTRFTNDDSVNGSPATPLPFSCAIKMSKSSQLMNLRVMINYNGIDGYNDATSDGLGDNWDIGIWVYDSNASIIGNAQVVGYWRKGAILMTENAGNYDEQGNPEQTLLYNVYTQGMRGLMVRNTPQIQVTAVNSAAGTITVKYFPSWTLTRAMKFALQGSAKVYSFTGYNVDSVNGNITLTGVTPALPASLSDAVSMRSPVQGNNWSGTVFDSCRFGTLNHMSGKSSSLLGLGQALALEADGYPCRNLRFVGTKMQTVFDNGNSLFGDCRDWKFVAAAFENGRLIAYSDTDTNCQYSFTGNMRFDSATEINLTNVDISLFTPRDAIIDYLERNTQYATQGLRAIKNWRPRGVEVQFYDGDPGLRLVDSTGDVYLYNGNNIPVIKGWGTTNKTDFYGNGFSFYGQDLATKLFDVNASGNSVSYGVHTANGGLVTGSVIRPATANVGTCGTSTYPWQTGFTNTSFTVTSDMREKQDISHIPDEVLDAWADVSWQLYRLKVDVSQSENADYQAGLMAQEILAAFISHGVDATKYGVISYSKWEDEFDPDTGVLITAAGDRYGVNYTHALCIEAAYNRRELTKIKEALSAA